MIYDGVCLTNNSQVASHCKPVKLELGGVEIEIAHQDQVQTMKY